MKRSHTPNAVQLKATKEHQSGRSAPASEFVAVHALASTGAESLGRAAPHRRTRQRSAAAASYRTGSKAALPASADGDGLDSARASRIEKVRLATPTQRPAMVDLGNASLLTLTLTLT
eukprot:6200932-Pleurochrysis_carterae.AAC.1